MKVVTTAEMRRIEQKANAAGHSFATMMENAGRLTAQAIEERATPIETKRVVVLIGPGNNGGDGLVAARYLRQVGASVTVYIWKRTVDEDTNYHLVVEQGIPIVWRDNDKKLSELRYLVTEADILVDALLGTGVSRDIRGSLKELMVAVGEILEQRRRSQPPEYPRLRTISPIIRPLPIKDSTPLVVAVDTPSGLNCDTGAIDPATFKADLTVTFGYPKRGQFLFPGADYLGELVVADIGIPAELAKDIKLRLATSEIIRSILPARPLNAHKGTFGRAMVVAGSTNYIGAAYLASAAATRVGTGLVTLALAENLHPILASKLTEVTFLLLPHDMGALVPDALKVLASPLSRYQAMLMGPGLGRDPATVQFVARLIGGTTRRRTQIGFVSQPTESQAEMVPIPPMVIDADGLNALTEIQGWWQKLDDMNVLTPHPGEMDRLLKSSMIDTEGDRIELARKAAAKWRQVVLLKGAYTVVANPDGHATIIPFANPGLASAGTGDVLAGTVVGFLAQGLSPYDAAIAGAYIHGLAGELVREEKGTAGMVASDLLPMLPLAIAEIREPKTP